jgi:hypothetical protein
VPINEKSTRYYLRSYRLGGNARDDRLMGFDRAIIQFRRLHSQLLEREAAPLQSIV